jgi:hypothetical protein
VQPPALTALLRVWLRQNFGAAGWTVVVGLGLGVIHSVVVWLLWIQPALKDLGASYRRTTGDAPWLVADWAAPPWLTVALSFLDLFAIGFSGLATARLVRPRNRQADVAAGLVYGAVTGVVVFTLAIGWFVGLQRLQPSLEDLWLLSAAAWDDPDGADRPEAAGADRARIRERLLQKYPALREVPARERGRVLYEKVAYDLCTGIPVSIWAGTCWAVGTWVPLGVFGTAMGGRLLRRRGGVTWKCVLPYLEGMVPATLLCWGLSISIMLVLGGMRQTHPLWYGALLMGVLCLTVTVVLRGWHWAARAPLHAAWIALSIASPWFELR